MYDPRAVAEAQKRNNTAPGIQAAGKSYNANLGKLYEVESTAIAMRPDRNPDVQVKSPVPEHLRKFTQAYRQGDCRCCVFSAWAHRCCAEPGTRFIHPGMVDMKVPDKRFGVTSVLGERVRKANSAPRHCT
jgi:hypothetical protein